MTRRGKDKFLTEYQVINQWRNNVVSCSYIMTYIFMPAATGIFFSYYLIENFCRPSQWLFWIASSVLIAFWRFYALYLDKSILDFYPRICELEDKFNFNFTQEYLRRAFLKKCENHTLDQLKGEIEELRKWYQYIRFSFTSRTKSRGHIYLNWFAIGLIIGELFIIIKVNN